MTHAAAGRPRLFHLGDVLSTTTECLEGGKMSKEAIRKAERRFIKVGLARLRIWKKENPEGLLPLSHTRAIPRGTKRDFVIAALALDAAMQPKRRARR